MKYEKIPPPHKKLATPSHEAFSKAVATGTNLTQAYKLTVAEDGTSMVSIKASAWALSKKPHIAARIKYLRKKINQSVNDHERELTGEDIARLMVEVTRVYENAITTAEISCLASRSTMQKLRDRLVLHLSRVGKSVQESDPLEKGKVAPLKRIEYCNCGDENGR